MKTNKLESQAIRLLILIGVVFSITQSQSVSKPHMLVSVVNDQTAGFYYVRSIIYLKDVVPDTFLSHKDTAAARKAFEQQQTLLGSYFDQHRQELADPSFYTITEPEGSSVVAPARIERLKLVLNDFDSWKLKSHQFVTHLSARIVAFLIVVLDPGKSYDVFFRKGTTDELKSDTSVQLLDNSYFSPLEVDVPFKFDIQPASGSTVNAKLVYRDRLSSSSQGYSQYNLTLEGMRISKDLDDSLHSVAGSLGAKMYWHGGNVFQSGNFFLDAKGNATKKFTNYDYGISFGLDVLMKILANTEGASLSIAGEIMQYRQSSPDSIHSSNRLAVEVQWHPRFDRYRLDLELKNWLEGLDVQNVGVNEFSVKVRYLYYYRFLVSVLGNGTIEPFLGIEQGYLPPSFVFTKQINAGVRFKIDNLVSNND